MNHSSSISVVMATCNGGRYLSEQLQSIAKQIRPPDELIVSDDASTDDTVEIVKKFARTATFPVKIVENRQRLGYGGNFISAVRHATGTYISFCDQDDIWLPSKILVSLNSIEEFDVDLYVHGAIIVDATGREVGRFAQGIRKRCVIAPLTLPPWGVFYGFAMVFRREIFDLIDADERGGHTFEWDGSLSHDLWVYFIASSLGRIFVDPKPLVMYRRHDKNVTPDLKGSLIRKLSTHLGVAAHKNLRRDAIAAHRSKILLNFSRSSHPSRLRGNAKAASIYWNAISHFEAARMEIYTRDRALNRLSLCLKLLRMGGYRAYRRGGLSLRLFLKDILSGVLRLRRRVANN